MYIIDPAWKVNKNRLLKWQKAVVFIAIVISIWGIAMASSRAQHALPQARPLPVFDIASIGRGPLGLIPKTLSPIAQEVVQELLVIGVNNRPDQAVTTLTLGCKTSGDTTVAVMDQPLYLTDDWRWSKTPTDRTLTTVALQGDEVVMQLACGGQMSEEFNLIPSPLFQQPMDDHPYVQALKAGKGWAFDRLLHDWGGEEYRFLSLKHKVQIGSSVHFLDVKDCLWWDGSTWKPGLHSDAPLAQLIASYDRSVQMGVWDEKGTSMVKIDIPVQSSGQIELNPREMMKGVKVRSHGEIVCQLGRRRVIVKEGDWWIKVGGRFRPLRSVRDLEAFLRHEIQGELVMFEKIETSQDQVCIKGRYFDHMRTKEEPLTLTLDSGKKGPSLRTKHSGSSSLLAKNKMMPPTLAHQSEEHP
jgi:hypothetical protein